MQAGRHPLAGLQGWGRGFMAAHAAVLAQKQRVLPQRTRTQSLQRDPRVHLLHLVLFSFHVLNADVVDEHFRDEVFLEESMVLWLSLMSELHLPLNFNQYSMSESLSIAGGLGC